MKAEALILLTEIKLSPTSNLHLSLVWRRERAGAHESRGHGGRTTHGDYESAGAQAEGSVEQSGGGSGGGWAGGQGAVDTQ